MPTTFTNNPPPRRRARFLLVAVVFFALTVILFYVEENWRGQHAWREYRAELQKSGTLRDWSEFIPAPVPDEENVFAAPSMEQLTKGRGEFVANPGASPGMLGALATNSVLAARVFAAGSGPTGAVRVATVAEARAAIHRHAGPRALGATGVQFASRDLLKREPLLLVIEGSGPLATNLFATQPGSFSVRQGEGGSLSIWLGELIEARDYLAWREPGESLVKEISAILDRPGVYIPGDYRHPFRTPTPNFVGVRSLAQILAQDIQCFLLTGQAEEAVARLRTFQKIHRLLQTGRGGKPLTLVEAMVDVAIHGLGAAIIEDGLRLGAWGDAELAEISEQLSRIRLLPNVISSLSGELSGVVAMSERGRFSEVMSVGDDKPKRIFDLFPRGWAAQNTLCYAELMSRQIASVERALPFVFAKEIDGAFAEVESNLERPTPFVYLSRIAIPNTRKALQTTAYNEVYLRQALIVCALERFRLAHGRYPLALDQLVPKFLREIPLDLFGGGAFRYSLRSDQEFLLYSIGWNEREDGGQGSDSRESGDWVWTTALGE